MIRHIVPTTAMRDILSYCAGRLPERSISAGEVIMVEGQRDGVLFILAEGAVEVLKGDFQINIFTDPGAVFGEISVLLDTPHTATVRTVAPSRFYVVEQPLDFLRSTPDLALGVASLLAKRLHAMTTYLVDLKRQFEDHDSHLGMVDEVLDALTHAQHEEHAPGSDRDDDGGY
jgi:CRP/FNR family transcriptional regulator, cyclic AMP receptor protein